MQNNTRTNISEARQSMKMYLQQNSPVQWKYNTIFIHRETGEKKTLQDLFRIIPKPSIDPKSDEWITGQIVIRKIDDGLARKKGVTKQQVDQHEFAIGLEVEREHTNDPKRIEQTVLDHLAENPHYYTLLKKAHLEESKMTNKSELQKEVVSLLKNIIKEQVMSIYNKKGKENINKSKKPKTDKKIMATTEDKYPLETDSKKEKFVEELLELAHKYNTTVPIMEREDLIKELAKIGKAVNAKKADIEKNIESIPCGRKLYVHELAELMVAHKNEDEVESVAKKPKDPEKAKKVSNKDREYGKEEKKETKKLKDSKGKSEAAPKKPKGIGSLNNKTVKTMKDESLTKFKSFLTGKK